MRSFCLAAWILSAGVSAAASAPAWVQTAKAIAVPAQEADTAAVVLFDETVVSVAASGEITTQRRRAVKVLNSSGREHAYGAAAFDDRTRLRTLRGWSIAPDGKVQAVKERDAVESIGGSFEVFTDSRMKVLDLPSEVGSVVAYESVTREQPYEQATVWRFQEAIPVLQSRFELKLPAGWSHGVQWMNHPPVAGEGSVWTLTNVAALSDEPRMPYLYAIAGRAGVHWSSPGTPERSWSRVASWFHGLAASRLASTAALDAKTRTLTEGGRDAIHALAQFAQRDIRYVAIAIGIGGYQPHAAGEILANSYGDCKDKATILKAMLRGAGTEVHYLLVNTTRGMVDPSFPTITAFDHVITAIRVPKERAAGVDAIVEHPKLGTLLLFDPTSTLTPLGQLPSYLQASRGLLVTADGGELIDLPAHKAEANELRRVAKFELSENGMLRGSVVETRTGDVAASMRGLLQPLDTTERVRVIDESLGAHMARQTAADVKIENLDDPEADLVIRYSLTAQSYVTRVGDMLLVRPRVIGAKGERAIAAGRKHPYETDGPSLHTDEFEITFTGPVRLDELPKAAKIVTPEVRYESAAAFEGKTLRYRRTYAMHAHVVPADAAVALGGAFAKIAADERANAVFK